MKSGNESGPRRGNVEGRSEVHLSGGTPLIVADPVPSGQTLNGATLDAVKYFASWWQGLPTASPTVTREQRYRRTWARQYITSGKQAGDIPVYGSVEWCQLPTNDPRKIAAAFRAAEAWATEGDNLEFRLRQEDYDRRREERRRWAEHVGTGHGRAADEALTVHRRRQEHQQHAADRARVGSDYQGGAVEWETGRTVGEAAA